MSEQEGIGDEKDEAGFGSLLFCFLLFHEQQRPSDPVIQKPLNCNLVVPTNPQVHQVVDLDRIVANFYVTEDLTIRVDAESSSLGRRETIEIQDICYGLEVA